MFVIAQNTFRELLRSKLVSLILFVGIALILLSLGLKTISLWETSRMLIDYGLSFTELTGVVLILIITPWLITREISERTLYLLLAKPIPRERIILGKWLWLAWVLGCVVLSQTLVLWVLFFLEHIPIEWIFWVALLGIYGKLLILSAISLFLTIWVSPFIAQFATLVLYWIGHSTFLILDFSDRHGNTTYAILGHIFAGIFPNFSSLNLKTLVWTGVSIDVNSIFLAFLSAILYLLVILILMGVVFRRKKYDTI